MDTIIQHRRISTLDLYQDDNLQEWIGFFLHACRARNLAPGTIEFYVKKLNAFVAFCADMAITNVSQITPATIRHFLIHLEQRHHKPGGIHCCYRSLKTFLKWFEQEIEQSDWQNPIDKVKAPIMPLEPLDPVGIDDIRVMIQACIWEGTAARDKACLLFLLDTGVRLAEFLALNREDVNFVTGEIQIRRGKGRKPRNVYMGDKTRHSLRKYLKERKDYNPALWVNKFGERLTGTGLRQILRRRATQAGVSIPSPHDFRRAFALERWRGGIDIVTLSRLMGHSSLQILSRYMKQIGYDLEQAAKHSSPVDLNF